MDRFSWKECSTWTQTPVDGVFDFNGLKCSTDVFSIVKSSIQSTLTTLTTLSEAESCVDTRMPFAERRDCAFFDVAAFCQRYPPVMGKILRHLLLKDIRRFSFTCRDALFCVRKLLKEECELQIAVYQKKLGVNPVALHVNDVRKLRNICRYGTVSPEKKTIVNVDFLTRMGLWIINDIASEVIVEQYGDAFAKAMSHNINEIFAAEQEALTICNKTHFEIVSNSLQKAIENNRCENLWEASCEDIQHIILSSKRFRIVKRDDQFLTAICDDEVHEGNWLEKRNRQLKMSKGATFLNDYVTEDASLWSSQQDSKTELKKVLWIQINCQSTNWADTLFEEEILANSARSKWLALESYVLRYLMYECMDFRKFLVLLKDKKLNEREEEALKKYTKTFTQQILKDETLQRRIYETAQNDLMEWLQYFRKTVLSYLSSQGHIIFCYKMSRSDIVGSEQHITRCFEKAFFMYYLVENEDDANHFVDKYSNDILNGGDGHFSWKILCIPLRASCTQFVPEGIIKGSHACICQLAHVFGRYWDHQHSLHALKLKEMRYQVEQIAHCYVKKKSYHCYSRNLILNKPEPPLFYR